MSDLVQSRSCNVDVMHKGRHIFRKPDPLLLLALFVSLAVLITTAADAVAGALKAPTPAVQQDGDMQLARLGHHGPGVHLSLQTPRDGTLNHAPGATAKALTDLTPDVFINLRFPW